MKSYKLQFDGSCAPIGKNATAAYGFVLSRYDEGVLRVIERGHGVIGHGVEVNSVLAELWAMGKGLECFLARHQFWEDTAKLAVYGDNETVIGMMADDKWKSKNKNYYAGYEIARKAMNNALLMNADVTVQWVPRYTNTECDRLSKYHLSHRPPVPGFRDLAGFRDILSK